MLQTLETAERFALKQVLEEAWQKKIPECGQEIARILREWPGPAARQDPPKAGRAWWLAPNGKPAGLRGSFSSFLHAFHLRNTWLKWLRQHEHNPIRAARRPATARCPGHSTGASELLPTRRRTRPFTDASGLSACHSARRLDPAVR